MCNSTCKVAERQRNEFQIHATHRLRRPGFPRRLAVLNQGRFPRQHRHHRPRRPRQDHAGRQAAAAVRLPSARTSASPSARWIRTTSKSERGITILAKATSVVWKDTRINIVDTPGHADFGGEVERILNMVDGALVLVDAAEGPMPQTKFVVSKALKLGLRRSSRSTRSTSPDEPATEVLNEVFDLFAALDATDEQLDFPILYGSAKQGWMAPSPKAPRTRAWRRCST
jgi:translation elongation factor EF-Tu-like GTPase